MHNEHFCIVYALECYIYKWWKAITEHHVGLLVKACSLVYGRVFESLSGQFFLKTKWKQHWLGRFSKTAGSPVFTGFGRFRPVRQHNRSVEQLEPVTPPVPGWTGPTGRSGPIFKTMVHMIKIIVDKWNKMEE